MSGFLLDTNVISEPAKKAPNTGVLSWFEELHETNAFLSVLTLGELRAGIDRVSDNAKRTNLETFFSNVRTRFGGRVLEVTAGVAERWGRMNAELPRGSRLPVIDALLAATAYEYQLTVVTRNENDFVRVGVRVINPFT